MSASDTAVRATPVAAAQTKPRSGFLPERTVHLQPRAQDAHALCQALGVLHTEGYAVLSVSGGEPLAYPPLLQVLQCAKGLGYRVTMTSNGLLVNDDHNAVLDLLDGVAIAFDGLEATHNHWHGRPDAFAHACAAVRYVAQRGRPVAAAISLRADAWPEWPNLADHLVGLGASALHIRPVARAGRAGVLAEQLIDSPADQARLHLLCQALEQALPQVRVYGDLAPAQGLWQQREAYAGLLEIGDSQSGALPLAKRPLADMVNPLVITETGALKPVACDFDARFDVGRLNGLTAQKLAIYKRHGLPAFRSLMGRALAGLQDQQRLLDWFDHCTRLSKQHGRFAAGVDTS